MRGGGPKVGALAIPSQPAARSSAYTTRRPHQWRGMTGRTPLQAVIEGLPKPANQQSVTARPKQPKLKTALPLAAIAALSGDYDSISHFLSNLDNLLGI